MSINMSIKQTALCALTLWLCLLFAAPAYGQPGPYISPRWNNFSGDSFSSRNDHIVGAFFFYWYDIWTRQHMDPPKGKHNIRPDYDYLNPIPFSYKSPDWWAREMRRVAYGGIDMALLDYWTRGELYWSNPGLDQLNQGLNLMGAQGTRAPKIGMFFDTSSMKDVDLATPAGKDLLYNAIRDFYSRIRPDRWARINGRVVVVLYKGGGMLNVNGAAFREADARFAREFGGSRLFLIGGAGWRKHDVPISLTWEWGAAKQPDCTRITEDDIAGIGPGYTHLNGDVARDRRRGETYRQAWEKALRSGKRHVFIETWNELHEGTGILPTREHGSRELNATREYARRWRSR